MQGRKIPLDGLVLSGIAGAGLIGFALRPVCESIFQICQNLGFSGLFYVAASRFRQLFRLSPRSVTILDAHKTNAEGIAKYLRRDGCVCVTNVVDEATIVQLECELNPHFEMETRGIGGETFGGEGAQEHTGRVGSLMMKAPTCHKFATHPLLLGAIEAVLLPYTKKIAFKVTETIRMLPGGKSRQRLHQEEGQWPMAQHWPLGADYSVDILFAITDFTAANGGTHIVPGSNLWFGRGSQIDDSMPTIQAEMPRGSALLFTGSLVHAGGKNTTSKPRVGLALGYQVGYLRPEANHVLSVPPEKAKDLPPPIQELLGYPLRYTPVSKPGKYEAKAGAIAYKAASSYAYNGGPDGHPSRLVPYTETEETHHSF